MAEHASKSQFKDLMGKKIFDISAFISISAHVSRSGLLYLLPTFIFLIENARVPVQAGSSSVSMKIARQKVACPLF